MKILHWDGNLINDGENYVAEIPAEGRGLPRVMPQLGYRNGKHPRIGGISREGRIVPLIIGIEGANAGALKRALLRMFDYEGEEPKMLAIWDDDYGRERYIQALPTMITPMPFTQERFWVASLQVNDDVRWRGGSWAEEALLYLPFGGGGDDATNFDVDLRAWKNRGLGTATGGVIGRPGKCGRGVQMAVGTTNFVQNPSAETNTTGWSGSGSSTVSRVATPAYIGSYGFEFLATAQNEYATYQISASSGTGYHLQIRLKSPSDQIRVELFDVANSTILQQVYSSGEDDWELILLSGTTGAISGNLEIKILDTRSSGFTAVNFDAVMIETGLTHTPYLDGSLGDGHSWSGTAHASTSSRSGAQLSYSTTGHLKSSQGSICAWVWITGNNGSYQYIARALGGTGNIILRFDSARLNGYWGVAGVLGSSVEIAEWHHVAMTYADGTLKLYLDGVLDNTGSSSGFANMPTDMSIGHYGGAYRLNGIIDDFAIFDRALSATEIAAIYAKGAALGKREHWEITASGDTVEIENEGDDQAYPTMRILPTVAKTGGYSYKRWIPLRWRASAAYSKYPVDICNDSFDTATLVSGSKMQADGDDLRVLVDGAEVDRWLDGINTSTTKVWVNLDFQAKQEGTLAADLASSGTIDTIDLNEDISGWPSSGIIMVGSEAFTYTGKNNSLKRFTGISRAAKGTSEAAHTSGDAAWWVQHDVWILYGNSSATAPTTDDNYKPAFSLSTSTNTSWDYDEFGEADGLRTAGWSYVTSGSGASFYTGDHAGSSPSPFVEIGCRLVPPVTGTYWTRWQVFNPCGITNANFQNGEKYAKALTGVTWLAELLSSQTGSSWTVEDTITVPSAALTWESWSDNEALTSGATYAAMRLTGTFTSTWPELRMECADVTLTLNSSYTPTLTIGSEQGNYSLDCTITNNTTEETIGLDFTMALDENLEIDTDRKTVTYLADDTPQFTALELVGGVRRDWLALEPGTNELEFTDTGTNEVLVAVEWEERFYD